MSLRNQDIIYEKDAVCLPCWTGYKPSTFIENNYHLQEELPKEPKEKKISLKRGSKPNLRSAHLRTDSIRSSVMQPLQAQGTGPLFQSANDPHVHCNYDRPRVIIRTSTLFPAQYRPPNITFSTDRLDKAFEQKTISNVNKPVVKWNIMQTTTKKSVTETKPSEELIKTKKNHIASIKSDLQKTSDLKVSIVSKGEPVERMEMSEVMLDFFHPTESKVKEIQKAISGQVIREEDSFEM